MRVHLLRRSLALVALAGFAVATASCRRQSEGVVQVVVIGDSPRLTDPQHGSLGTTDSVLVDAVGQGLVRLDARGQIEPGLAETWNVSDDGLSYIFRLATGAWPGGHKISADQVARMLRRLISRSSDDPLRDSFGAVDDIVGMTDRVIEIRLKQPRPHLLQLLAQPGMGLVDDGQGTGPFAIDKRKSSRKKVRLTREIATVDQSQPTIEMLDLSAATAQQAVARFAAGKADLVLGGTFADLPLAQSADLARRALKFDPASGLFGLIPALDSGLVANVEVRRLLSESIDRDSLVAALSVPGLVARATVLEPKLDNIADPVAPGWASTAFADRQTALAARVRRLLPAGKPAIIRIALPDGPGADILLKRLATDWGALGITVKRSVKGGPADLKLVDEVAPSSAASWFLRHFRCQVAPVCDDQVDQLLGNARNTEVLAQRSALDGEAAKRIDSLQLFLPIAAPIRWSLTGPRIDGFAGNRFAIHTLTALEHPLNRTGE